MPRDWPDDESPLARHVLRREVVCRGVGVEAIRGLPRLRPGLAGQRLGFEPVPAVTGAALGMLVMPCGMSLRCVPLDVAVTARVPAYRGRFHGHAAAGPAR